MNRHTLDESTLVKSGLNTAITAASNNGDTIDTLGFTRALVVFDSAPSGAGTTSDCKIQEDTDSGMGSPSDITGADFAQVTTAGGQQVQVMSIDLENGNRERYLRAVHTGAGASAAGQAFVTWLLYRHRHGPLSQDNTVVRV